MAGMQPNLRPPATPASVGRAWLDAMPSAAARQRAVIHALLDEVVAEPGLHWLELGCSLARGEGDELSDIDCAVGVAQERWPAVLNDGHRLIHRLGTPVDQTRERLPGRGDDHAWHFVALYPDGVELSMVLRPVSWRPGLPPRSVALFDRTGTLATAWSPPNASADGDEARQWAAAGWLAIADLAKYLDRGSLWEALQRLEQARDRVWRLWALAHGVLYPGYGLTSVLDVPGTPLPDRIAETVGVLNAAALATCGEVVTDLLADATARAAAVVAFQAPDGFRQWATARLSAAATRVRAA